jgi:hypothetical protein
LCEFEFILFSCLVCIFLLQLGLSTCISLELGSNLKTSDVSGDFSQSGVQVFLLCLLLLQGNLSFFIGNGGSNGKSNGVV